MGECKEGFCHNKKCEVHNQAQGNSGYEEQKNWPCIICHRILKKGKKKAVEWVKKNK